MVLIVDCSNTMAEGGKLQALNQALGDMLTHLKLAAGENPSVEILLRVVSLSGSDCNVQAPKPVAKYRWKKLKAAASGSPGGARNLGDALRRVASDLISPPTPESALPPALVLITDGRPTDDFQGALNLLMQKEWGKRAKRFGIAIGRNADLGALQSFIGDPRLRPLQAKDAGALSQHLSHVSAEIALASRPSW